MSQDIQRIDIEAAEMFGRFVAFEHMSDVMCKMVDDSTKKWFWYLRPSHYALMKVWNIINKEWGRELGKDITQEHEND